MSHHLISIPATDSGISFSDAMFTENFHPSNRNELLIGEIEMDIHTSGGTFASRFVDIFYHRSIGFHVSRYTGDLGSFSALEQADIITAVLEAPDMEPFLKVPTIDDMNEYILSKARKSGESHVTNFMLGDSARRLFSEAHDLLTAITGERPLTNSDNMPAIDGAVSTERVLEEFKSGIIEAAARL